MIEAKRQDTAEGAILFDASVLAQAGASGFDPAWFDSAHWRASEVAGGRGSVSYAETPFGSVVIRHYRRGGLIARVMGDFYMWSGENHTRGFAEFRLLAQLRDLGLPVPAPIAARYVRSGLGYRGDLVTRRIDNAETFADLLESGRFDGDIARRIGEAIAAFHAAGAYHADLNAHNILVTVDRIWIVDVDRGELRRPHEAWRRSNLERLHRSCAKVLGTAPKVDGDFRESVWSPLMRAYDAAFGRIAAQPLRSVRT
ncbi:MAG TPA: 3-deoxy-D-manno-octulosonic acid kinase [Rudaea sp.]|nr:3-deoxy-D-manno-octulosonic acid kinase [Rudaea sp.]